MVYEYYIYVIELDNPMTVYVGQTYLTPVERFLQHKEGYKSSKYVKKAKNPKLRPELYLHIAPFSKRSDALAKESNYADELREKGYKVLGGH